MSGERQDRPLLVSTVIEHDGRFEPAKTPVNDRQRKVASRKLEAGRGGFEGGLSTSNYRHLAAVSGATA